MTLDELLERRTHGRVSTYNIGCRCDPCRMASTAYRTGNRPVQISRNPSARPELFDPMPWTRDSVCAGKPQEIFFPTSGGKDAYDLAKSYCSACPVREECLAYALRTCQTDGCWGGLAPDERFRL